MEESTGVGGESNTAADHRPRRMLYAFT
jgi:hypothetical protein